MALHFETDIDRFDEEQVRLYVTQGDAFSVDVTPILYDDKGEELTVDVMQDACFKIYDKETLECMLCKHGVKLSPNKFLIVVNADENVLPIGKYKYEIEYTFVDGKPYTTNQYYIEILDQAGGWYKNGRMCK